MPWKYLKETCFSTNLFKGLEGRLIGKLNISREDVEIIKDMHSRKSGYIKIKKYPSFSKKDIENIMSDYYRHKGFGVLNDVPSGFFYASRKDETYKVLVEEHKKAFCIDIFEFLQ